MVWDLGFAVDGLAVKVPESKGQRVSGCRDLGVRVQGSRFTAQDSGYRFLDVRFAGFRL